MPRQYMFISGIRWRSRETPQRIVNMLHNIMNVEVEAGKNQYFEVQEINSQLTGKIYKIAFSSDQIEQLKTSSKEIEKARDLELAFEVGFNYRSAELINLIQTSR